MAGSGLIVRRAVRHEVVMPALVRVAPEHADTIRFAKGVTDPAGWIRVDLVDFANGGAGFVSATFFPRGGLLELQIPDHDAPEAPPLLNVLARVMRVQMTDRRPAYLVGVAYMEIDEERDAQIDALLARLNGEKS